MAGLGGVAAFMALSLVLGARLLALARRTRALPELVMGAAFLVAGVLGTGLGGLARAELAPAGWEATFTAASRLLIHVGAICQAVFTWRVFRPEHAWAKGAVALVAAGLAAHSAGAARAGVLGDPFDVSGWRSAEVGLQALAIGWGALESLAHWGRMRRRVRLGLADPLVADRFLLWGVALGAGVLALIGAAAGAVVPLSRAQLLLLYGSLASVGLVSGVSYWLTFFPPAWYSAHVLRRVSTPRG